jgi:alkylhydroperoxidase family enzyme
MRAYDFWDETGTAQSGPFPIASLSLRPSDRANCSEMQMMFHQGMPVETQLAVADRVLAVVQRWRDGIADAAETQRTTADELAQALAEIDRLKGAAGETVEVTA